MNDSQRWLYHWYWSAIAISIVFVAALPVAWYYPDFLPNLIGRMQLTMENRLGAWWSGVLLLMLAFHAYDAGDAHRGQSAAVGGAWTTLACVFLFLSADEVGSLHERLAILGDDIGVGSWGLVLALGAVIAFFLLRALYALWRHGGESRRQVLLLFIGFGLFGSVAVQEFIEHAVDWGTGAMIWIRGAIEEGTELLGMIVLLRVTLTPSLKILTRPKVARRRLFTLLTSHRNVIVLVLAGLIPVFAYLTIVFQDHRGRLSSWLTIVAFVAAAALTMIRVIGRESNESWRHVLIGVLCLAGSVVPMWFSSLAASNFHGFTMNQPVLAVGTLSLLICIGWRMWQFAILLGISIVAASVFTTTPFHVALLTQVLAVLTLGITYVAIDRPELNMPADDAVD